ncbi:unnamed protein product [Caenorhabditis angaria]|uniref:Peptidase M16 N-terminal domain-containing protein n=1 Tax=Caenorhabditis angaria TaxID=860376 RepID=A0A9P1IZG2_9PELO|nr:unnamed protein product [Caenorhabditis angaria]
MLSNRTSKLMKRFASAAASSARGARETTSVLGNGLSVSSIELNGATSSLVLAFRAGSRYQPAAQQGLVQIVRNSIGRDSQEFPGLQLVWNTAQNGGKIAAVSNRDILAIQLDVVRDNAGVGLSLLGQLGTNAFKPWDTEDVKHDVIPTENTYLTGQSIVFEQIHEAAFRNGPLAFSNYGVNSVSSKSISEFAAQRLTAGEAVLVGVNIDHELLVNAASQQFPLAENAATPVAASKYYGGDVRKFGSGNRTFVAIAGQGAALKSTKEVATQAVVAQILINAAAKTSNASSINVSYAESGLVGVQFDAPNGQINSTTTSTLAALKSANTSDIENVKQFVANNILITSQDARNVALDRASQILAGAEASSPAEIAAAVRNVNANDATQLLKQVTSKLSLAAYGNPALVPYLD